jgi:hypothetical protein
VSHPAFGLVKVPFSFGHFVLKFLRADCNVFSFSFFLLCLFRY